MRQKHIVFFWAGLTAYAARALEALRQAHANTTVVAIKSSFPYKGIEDLFRGKIVWVDEETSGTLEEICGQYDIVFTAGWAIPVFNRFCTEARAKRVPIVCTLDNNWEFSLATIAKSIRFRLKQRKLYDAFFVPGISGERLLRFYGVPRHLIARGFYAGDNKTFMCNTKASQRENKILYVGQLNERKNIIRVCEAFLQASLKHPSWTLEICGCGPLRDRIPVSNKIIVNDFLQPGELAEKYQTAKAFILASLEEHWGVVVHEAALAGCAMLLSKKVGAATDFLTGTNGESFNPTSVRDIALAMDKVMQWSSDRFDRAQVEILALAKNFGGEVFAASALEIAKTLEVL